MAFIKATPRKPAAFLRLPRFYAFAGQYTPVSINLLAHPRGLLAPSSPFREMPVNPRDFLRLLT
jgi:hypothetical protein